MNRNRDNLHGPSAMQHGCFANGDSLPCSPPSQTLESYISYPVNRPCQPAKPQVTPLLTRQSPTYSTLRISSILLLLSPRGPFPSIRYSRASSHSHSSSSVSRPNSFESLVDMGLRAITFSLLSTSDHLLTPCQVGVVKHRLPRAVVKHLQNAPDFWATFDETEG